MDTVSNISESELLEIASDYAYVISGDLGKITARLLDSDFTETLLPIYIEKIVEWEELHNTTVRFKDKFYKEKYKL